MNLVFLRTQTLCRAYVCFTVLFCTCHFAVGTVELFRSMRCRAANFGRQRNVVGLIFSVAPRQFSLKNLLVGFFFSTNCFTCIFVFFFSRRTFFRHIFRHWLEDLACGVTRGVRTMFTPLSRTRRLSFVWTSLRRRANRFTNLGYAVDHWPSTARSSFGLIMPGFSASQLERTVFRPDCKNDPHGKCFWLFLRFALHGQYDKRTRDQKVAHPRQFRSQKVEPTAGDF